MNEDSGGTPNPLNSNPDEAPNMDALDANPAELMQDDNLPTDSEPVNSEYSRPEDNGSEGEKPEENEPKENRPEDNGSEGNKPEEDVNNEQTENNLIASNFGDSHDKGDDFGQSHSTSMEEATGNTVPSQPERTSFPDQPSGRESTGQSSGLMDSTPQNNADKPKHSFIGMAGRAKQEEPTVINVSVDSLDPTGRSMQKEIEQAPPPRPKHTKAIMYTIIGCVFFLIGIGAAVAAVKLLQKKPDPVGDAMHKIMSGEAPKYVAIDGDIDILMNDNTLPIKRVNIDLDSDIAVGSMVNTSTAVVTLTDRTDNDYSAKFNEIYAANGDLYFKLEGINDLFNNTQVIDLLSGSLMTTTEEQDDLNCVTDENGVTNCEAYSAEDALNCTTDENGVTNCEPYQVAVDCTDEGTDCTQTTTPSVDEDATPEQVFSLQDGLTNMTIYLIDAADGVWLRIPTDELHLTDGNDVLGSSAISCVTNLVDDVNKNSNSAAEMYNRYPFINSTDEKVPISSKSKNPVYQVSLDARNFTDYINAIGTTDLARTLYKCMGWKNNASVTDSDVSKIVDAMPKSYVEVDKDNNFTRLYIESDINNGAANAIIDLGFQYPSIINVSEPVEYTDYGVFIQTLFSSMFNLNGQGTEGQPVEMLKGNQRRMLKGNNRRRIQQDKGIIR